MLVVDASVAVKWFIEQDATDLIRQDRDSR